MDSPQQLHWLNELGRARLDHKPECAYRASVETNTQPREHCSCKLPPKQRTRKGKSPTQRTLEELRKRGYPLVQVVERWNPHARKRQDLFGIADVIAVGADILAVQTTSASNVAARVSKITESPALPVLRKAGIRVLVHGWRKKGGRYVLREVDLS